MYDLLVIDLQFRIHADYVCEMMRRTCACLSSEYCIPDLSLLNGAIHRMCKLVSDFSTGLC